LGETKHGILAWQVTSIRKDSDRFYTPVAAASGKQCWSLLPVTEENLDSWLVVDLVPVIPAELKHKTGGLIPSATIGLTKQGPKLSLLKFAATRGFRRLTVPYMIKLCRVLKVKHSRLEVELVRILATKALGSVSLQQLQEMMVWRGKQVAETDLDATSMLLHSANLEVITDGIEEEEVAEHAMKLKERAAKRKRATPAAASSSSTAPAAPSGHVFGNKPLKKLPDQDSFTLEEARQYFPDVKGCRLIKDLVKHSRWQCTYPREGQVSTSKAFGSGTGLSDRVALGYVLNVVWAWHQKEGGEPCPWDIAAVLEGRSTESQV